MIKYDKNKVKKTAEKHVDWFLNMVRPLMITEFEHGYKHRVDDEMKEK